MKGNTMNKKLNWEEEFDRLSSFLASDWGYVGNPQKIKTFIKDLLRSQQLELLEKIKKMDNKYYAGYVCINEKELNAKISKMEEEVK